VSPVAQTAGGRPSVDRQHNFPTPPASAVGISAQGAGYEPWSSNMAALPGSQSLSIDTAITNQRSMPNTPASTPPGKTTQGTAHYPTPSYDTSRSVYPSHTTQGSYPGQQRFSQALPGFKSMSIQKFQVASNTAQKTSKTKRPRASTRRPRPMRRPRTRTRTPQPPSPTQPRCPASRRSRARSRTVLAS
jgi:protein SOK2